MSGHKIWGKLHSTQSPTTLRLEGMNECSLAAMRSPDYKASFQPRVVEIEEGDFLQ